MNIISTKTPLTLAMESLINSLPNPPTACRRKINSASHAIDGTITSFISLLHKFVLESVRAIIQTRNLHHINCFDFTMSSPAEFYKSLPPVSKAYGTLCVLTTAGYHIGLINPNYIFLDYDQVIKHLQIWRLITNFLFLGPFSINFGIRLLIIARYGVQLEKGPFNRRTADFLWMMIFGIFSLLGFSLIPSLRFPFMGLSLVFMLIYIWAREFPESQISIYGLFTVKGFYLPWVMLALNVIFGAPLLPDLMGIIVGHLYYFLAVLHPLSGGRDILATPLWVDKLVEWWNVGPQGNNPVQPRDQAAGTAFRGRSYRLGR